MRGAGHTRGAVLQAGEDRGSNVRSYAKACPVGVDRRSIMGGILGGKTQPVGADLGSARLFDSVRGLQVVNVFRT